MKDKSQRKNKGQKRMRIGEKDDNRNVYNVFKVKRFDRLADKEETKIASIIASNETSIIIVFSETFDSLFSFPLYDFIPKKYQSFVIYLL